MAAKGASLALSSLRTVAGGTLGNFLLIMINKRQINTQCGWPAWEASPLELSLISGGGEGQSNQISSA